MGGELWRFREIFFEDSHPIQRDWWAQQEIRALPEFLQVRKRLQKKKQFKIKKPTSFSQTPSRVLRLLGIDIKGLWFKRRDRVRKKVGMCLNVKKKEESIRKREKKERGGFISFSVVIYFNMPMSLMFFRAANLNHGHWTTPYFDCNGKVNKWVITYASPFFGWDSLKAKLEFKWVLLYSFFLFLFLFLSSFFFFLFVLVLFCLCVVKWFSCGG